MPSSGALTTKTRLFKHIENFKPKKKKKKKKSDKKSDMFHIPVET